MSRLVPESFLTNSRKLRKNQTPWEAKLWRCLRANRFFDLSFKRQVQIGNYIVDFSCRSKMIIIELDGSQHIDRAVSDGLRDNFLKQEGYEVLRFWNNEVGNNLEDVLERIKAACEV
jgi:very-short-patch-repair endonuclease